MISSRYAVYASALLKNLHFVYLIYVIPLACILITLTPAFQNPDEPNHFSRAEQISRGELIAKFVYANQGNKTTKYPFEPDKGGFSVNVGINRAYALFENVQRSPDVKVTKAITDNARLITWQGKTEYKNFGNTAIYPPIVYLMPAMGVVIGKSINLNVVDTLTLCRYLNAGLTILLGFLAIKMARSSKLALFALLLLPMVTSVFAAVTQDGLLIACSFLLIALVDYRETLNEGYTVKSLGIIALLLSLIAIAKPPYVLFALIVPLLSLSWRQKIVVFALPFCFLVAWLVINSANFSVKFAPAELQVNTKMQLEYIFSDPIRFIGMFFKWGSESIAYFFRMLVGILGWLDTQFKPIYYHLTYVLFALIAMVVINKSRQAYVQRLGLLLIFILTCVAVFTAQYVTWVNYKAHELGAMQGRYILPVVPFLALALTFKKQDFGKNSYEALLMFIVVVFPIYTLVCIVNLLMSRYHI